MSSFPSSSLTHASSLVLKCGVSPCLLGFKYLVHAVSLYSFLSAPSLSSVYRDTASFFSVSLKSVSRDISYALSRADNIHSLLSSLVGIPIPSYEIRSGFVISHLALLSRARSSKVIIIKVFNFFIRLSWPPRSSQINAFRVDIDAQFPYAQKSVRRVRVKHYVTSEIFK